MGLLNVAAWARWIWSPGGNDGRRAYSLTLELCVDVKWDRLADRVTHSVVSLSTVNTVVNSVDCQSTVFTTELVGTVHGTIFGTFQSTQSMSTFDHETGCLLFQNLPAFADFASAVVVCGKYPHHRQFMREQSHKS